MQFDPNPSDPARLARAFNGAGLPFALWLMVCVAGLLVARWNPVEKLQLVAVGLLLVCIFLIVWAVNVWTVSRLAIAVGISAWVAVLASFFLLLIAPVGAAWVVLLYVLSRSALRERGARVGLLWVSRTEVERLAAIPRPINAAKPGLLQRFFDPPQ